MPVISSLRSRMASALAVVPLVLTLAPTATAVPGLSHGPMKRDSSSTSSNWSGYATTMGPFTSVSASWTQPTVNCAATGKKSAYSSFWVGIDGDGSSTVEQT
ncbi:MAG: G1 family glutamic endopeptidase, partial [Marmoricola sp.]